LGWLCTFSTSIRTSFAAEGQPAAARRTALTRLATQLDAEASGSSDQAKVRALASVARELAGAR
jgi:hypothetical protein